MSDIACPPSPPPDALWNAACNSSFSIGNDLSVFSTWRGERGNDSIALWTLFTGCSDGDEVGVAWLGQLCQYNAVTQGNQSVSGTNVVSTTQSSWQVLAHELGHGFGAYHDCTSQLCDTDQPCCPLSTTTCDANQQFIVLSPRFINLILDESDDYGRDEPLFRMYHWQHLFRLLE
jgi:hypothetical protein